MTSPDAALPDPAAGTAVAPAPGPDTQLQQRTLARAGDADTLPQADTVLLLVDLVNPLDFDGAQALAEPAVQAATVAATLKRRLAEQGVPSIYVNDNFGRWRSDFLQLVDRCRQRGGPAASLVRRLSPGDDDLAVLKPRGSGFHGTPLELLLTQMGARRLIVTGLATDLCVLFTAADAYHRGYELWVPADACAAESPARHRAALDWMAVALKARTDLCDVVDAATGMPFADRRDVNLPTSP